MLYWNDTKEAIGVFVKLWEKLFQEKEFQDALVKVNQLVLYDYALDGPDASFWIDLRGGELKVGTGKPAGEPDLTLSCSLDDGHLSWANMMNAVMAITRGRVRVKGNATGLLKLAPKTKKIAEIYKQMLIDMGMVYKLVKK